MSDEIKKDELKVEELKEQELDTVAGGTRARIYTCPTCHNVVSIDGSGHKPDCMEYGHYSHYSFCF